MKKNTDKVPSHSYGRTRITSRKRALSLTLILAAAIGAPVIASAQEVTYEIVANGNLLMGPPAPITALLTLNGYTLGAPLSSSELVNFSYSSPPFDIGPKSPGLQLTGDIDIVDPAQSIVLIQDDQYLFEFANGLVFGGAICNPTQCGIPGGKGKPLIAFTAFAGAPVPEPSPASLLLLGLSAMGMGYVLRRAAKRPSEARR